MIQFASMVVNAICAPFTMLTWRIRRSLSASIGPRM
jgi:hypothetical protein